MNENENLERGQTIKEPGRHWASEIIEKYIEVWLFSILFGALSGVSMSTFFFNGVNSGKWGLLGIPATIFIASAAAFSILAWITIGRFFSGYLIPKYILQKKSGGYKDAQAKLLSLTMSFLIAAIVFRLCATVFDIFMQVLSFV